MKIKVYFVTYYNDDLLLRAVNSLIDSGIVEYDFDIRIINNRHDNVINMNFKLPVEIINNNTRPTFSTGHLSRNWNECLIDGFRSVSAPDADIVILCQNDVEFIPNIFTHIIESHNKYNFITNGAGDAYHSYKIDAIKTVGLWDERFCNIGYQEADYFSRQLLQNGERCSINDEFHRRVHNPISNIITPNLKTGYTRNDIHHHNSMKHHKISHELLQLKWGAMVRGFGDGKAPNKSPQRIMYPYFECDIENIAIKYGDRV